MKNILFATALFTVIGFLPATSSRAADETMSEKVEESVHDTKRATKKAFRNAKEKGCELMNGKMDCTKRRIKNRAKDMGDKVEDAVD